MELVFAYLAGILTLINPCVIPVLPIVLASALNAGRSGPWVLSAGLTVSFVAFGMFVTTLGYSIGLTQERLAQIGALVMIMFGLVLLVPVFLEDLKRQPKVLQALQVSKCSGSIWVVILANFSAAYY